MIGLGLRLALGAGRAGWLRTVLMSCGAAAGVFVLLACLAGLSVAQAQQRRAEARSPVLAHQEAGGLRLIEINDVVGERPLRRIAVGGATAGSPRPPGLRRFPVPGEVVVSPALAALIRSDPRAAGRFPQRVSGTIGRAGLVAPDELRAYVGVAADDPRLTRVRSFGGPLTYAGGGQTSADPRVYAASPGLALGVALFVLVPLGVFLATCARLSASVRDRRIAALRLLGISARQAARVNAVETGAVAAAGSLLGLLLYAVTAPLSQGWRIGRLHWYAADIGLPAAWLAGVCGLVVGFAMLVAVLATRAARTSPLEVRRDAPGRRPSGWRAVPLGTALAAGAVAGLDTPLTPQARALLLAVALLLTAAGLPLVVPLAGYAVAGHAERSTPLWLSLAGARLRHAPGDAPRLAAGLTAAIYLAGLGALGTVVAADTQAVPADFAWVDELPYQLGNPGPALAAELRGVPGLVVMEVAPVAAGLAATCADFTEMYDLAAGDTCADGETYGLDFTALGGPRAPDGGLPALHPVRQRHATGYSGARLLTGPGRAPAEVPVMLVAPDRVTAGRAAMLVARHDPAGAIDGDLGFRAGADEDLAATLLTAGMLTGFALGIGAFVVAIADRTVARRRDDAALAMAGVRPALLAWTETAYAAVPLLLGLALAALGTMATAVSLARVLGFGVGAVVRQAAAVGWLGGAATALALALIAAVAGGGSRAGVAGWNRESS